jgi:drug/metabolite transporter (DMT)-like permease
VKNSFQGPLYALAAAALFGASVPFSKGLVSALPPVLLAGLLYLGAGLGLGIWWLIKSVKKSSRTDSSLKRTDLPWLGGACLFGGLFAPILLMLGLARIPAATASLLLNCEGVFTAAFAWFIFKENFNTRVVVGMGLIVVAGGLLSWSGLHETGSFVGTTLILGACLCWGIDNNVTRKISASDPLQIAAVKCFVAGIINLVIAVILLRPNIFQPVLYLKATVIGFVGYGLSLTLFVRALREVGAARTSAYFSSAPFMGTGIAFILYHDNLPYFFWIALALMAIGVWLHLSECHEHEHAHEPIEHDHLHVHDEHHQHSHAEGQSTKEPHSHLHRHERLIHSHPHYPDLHHQHSH